MKALYAPAPLPASLRFTNFQTAATVKESSFGTHIPQSFDLAKRVMTSIRRKNTPLKFYAPAFLQIIEREIEDCLRLHMAGLSTPPKYKFTVTVKVENSFVTAFVVSEKE